MMNLSVKYLKNVIKKSAAFVLTIGLSIATAGITGSYMGTVQVNAAEYSSMVGECIADFTLSDYYDLTPPSYNTYYPWECVWYACGRAEEKAGHKISEIRGLGNAGEWYDKTELDKGTEIRSNSILCYGKTSRSKYGHVIYIECVQGDTVYYTEANVDGGKSDEQRSPSDGVLKKSTVKALESPENFQGYIYLDKFIDGELMLGDDNIWHFYKDGEINTVYRGVARNQYGWWKISNGDVDFSFSGLTCNESDNSWWKIVNGAADIGYNGLVQNEYGWWKVSEGKVDFSYNGLAWNEYGWWKVSGGKVDFSYNGLAQNEYGWWKVSGGKVDFSYSGLAQNENGWWKVSEGKVDFSCNGLVQNEYGWWKVSGGKVDFSYNGLYKDDYGLWYINEGKVDFNYNGVYKWKGVDYRIANGCAQKNVAKSNVTADDYIE